MKGSSILRRLSVVVGLAGLLMATQGCTYLQHRGEDFAEMVDVGITLTDTPQWGFYWNSLEIFPVGYSEVDGTFVGWGGGQFGATRLYNKCWGFGYGHEIVGWGEFDKYDESTLYVRNAGIIGIASPPYENGPAYTPACVHFFPHIGYAGLVWNARYMEMIDFFLGWTTLDICGDDGVKIGDWSL